jgi:hypothetical protein
MDGMHLLIEGCRRPDRSSPPRADSPHGRPFPSIARGGADG